jgi:preprotein translocase subunit SecD/SecD/SecF fusion protein
MVQMSRWKVILLALSLVFGLLFSYANALTPEQREGLPGWLPKPTLNLGLDLQGGSYLLLQVDVEAMREKRINNLNEDARQTLSEAQIAVAGIARDGNGVVITLNNPVQMEPAVTAMRGLLGGGMAVASDRTVTRQGDNAIRYAFTDAAVTAMGPTAVDQSIEVVRRRIDSLGTREPSITRQGADRIVVQAPGESDPTQLERVIGQTAQLTFQMVDVENSVQEALAGAVPPDAELLIGEDGVTPYLVKRRVIVSGENLVSASVTTDQSNQPAIGFRFDGQGARRFGETTANNIGRPFAIILDGKVISAPRINSAITGGNGIIEGSFTIASASELVNLLNGGSLPAPLTVLERRSVTASLGADAVQAGQLATLIAFAGVLVFMVLSYGGLFGGISVVAPDTEAELLGVPVGGLLLAVDGQHVIGMRLPTVKKKLLEAGRPLTLTVLSDSSFKQADVETVSMAVVPAPAAPTKESLLEKGLRMRALELKEGPSLGFLVDESADASHLVIISEVLT